MGMMLQRVTLGQRVGMCAAVLALAMGLGLIIVSGPAAAQSATPSVQRGAQEFEDHCQVCHGVYAQGRMGPPLLPLPPFIAELPRDALVTDLTELVRHGIPGRMPQFPPELLSDEEVAAIVDWVRFQNSQPQLQRSFYEALAPARSTESNANVTYVAETRHTISFGFKVFYEQNGGAARFGNPLTEEYSAYSEVDGQQRTMQLFERARFEFNPANGEVRLSEIGQAEMELRLHFLGEGPGGPPGP